MAIEDLDYFGSSLTNRQQRTTTIEIPNPDHPRNHSHLSDEMLQEFYQAGLWSRDYLGPRRAMLVGHFLMAVQELEEEGSADQLNDLYNNLTR